MRSSMAKWQSFCPVKTEASRSFRRQQHQALKAANGCRTHASGRAIRAAISSATRGSFSTSLSGRMHNPDYTPINSSIGSSGSPATAATAGSVFSMQVQFSAAQQPPQERRLGELIAERIARKQFFYGVELAARSFGRDSPNLLDYGIFGTLLPLFTSVVWLGEDYWQVAQMCDVESIRFARKLHPQTVVLPHFSCYRTDDKRLAEFLSLNFSNVLAVRGDQVDDGQEYKHASGLVTAIRRHRNDSISIGVAGYPEGHPDSNSLEEDMQFLQRKVAAGADFIITQICFSARVIIKFIENCRAHGVVVPIIVGVYIPESLRSLERMIAITHVHMEEQELARYREIGDNPHKFREFAVQRALDMLTTIFASSPGVYGVQFFSMNRFQNIQRVLEEIAKLDYFNLT